MRMFAPYLTFTLLFFMIHANTYSETERSKNLQEANVILGKLANELAKGLIAGLDELQRNKKQMGLQELKKRIMLIITEVYKVKRKEFEDDFGTGFSLYVGYGGEIVDFDDNFKHIFTPERMLEEKIKNVTKSLLLRPNKPEVQKLGFHQSLSGMIDLMLSFFVTLGSAYQH